MAWAVLRLGGRLRPSRLLGWVQEELDCHPNGENRADAPRNLGRLDHEPAVGLSQVPRLYPRSAARTTGTWACGGGAVKSRARSYVDEGVLGDRSALASGPARHLPGLRRRGATHGPQAAQPGEGCVAKWATADAAWNATYPLPGGHHMSDDLPVFRYDHMSRRLTSPVSRIFYPLCQRQHTPTGRPGNQVREPRGWAPPHLWPRAGTTPVHTLPVIVAASRVGAARNQDDGP